jgi:hypothetical protein
MYGMEIHLLAFWLTQVHYTPSGQFSLVDSEVTGGGQSCIPNAFGWRRAIAACFPIRKFQQSVAASGLQLPRGTRRLTLALLYVQSKINVAGRSKRGTPCFEGGCLLKLIAEFFATIAVTPCGRHFFALTFRLPKRAV